VIQHRKNPLNGFVKFFKGDYDNFDVTLTEAITCRIKDDDPTPGYLFKFKSRRPDQGKHSVTEHGATKSTKKFTIDKISAKKIVEMGEIVFLEGYNELNKEPLYVLRLKKYHDGEVNAK